MNGSEKQIEWAEQIKKNMMDQALHINPSLHKN